MDNFKKVILVIDWSNLMFRSLFMHRLFGDKSNGYNTPEDMKSFTFKFAVDVCSIVNMFKPNRVIIATDSQHAWRKDVYSDYKSNRDKDPNINWENIYKCSDDLLAILSANGMDAAQVDRAEADDIMAMVKECVFHEYPDYNMIIVSADADIRQLIDFNKETKQYCVVYNTTGRGANSSRRMYVTQEFSDWLEEPDECDIFISNIDANKNYMKDVLKLNTIIQLYVDNPNDVVLNKILCGDDGDSVPSFYGYYKNGRFVRITPTKSTKVLEMTGAHNVKMLCESVSKFPDIFEKICKKTIDDVDYDERLMRQRTLVELNSNLFPPHIREYKETISYILGKQKNIPVFMDLKAQKILEGTIYEGADKKKAIVADVFKDLDKIAAAKKTGKTVATTSGSGKPMTSTEQNVKWQIDALF